ncbi:MAG: hypothetical protein KDF65_05925, partial [Anaerolineae bacterium]|nr:hypothetical protein [Anaerolineae bacterium]
MNWPLRPRPAPLVWLFAALFIILGLGYSSLTPIFENSDETLHYPYVKHLADGQGLPLALPGQLWNQEATQPPLYYAIVAASTFWLDTDNLAEHLQRNPHWQFTEVRPLLNDNQNLVLHGPMDAFPYRRAALAIHIGRWWSLLFGLLTVIATFLIGRHLFPNNLPLVVTATALTALTPQFIRVSATVSNDSLSAALTSLAVLAALKFTSLPTKTAPLHLRSPAPLLLGLLCGLALLTKLSSLSTFFIVAVILFGRLFFLSEFHQQPLRRLVGWLLLMGLITTGLTGWWFLRNYQLYGEWLATEIHLDLAGRGYLSLAEIWQLRAEAERAYWATFGWGQIRPPEWVYQLLFWFSRIGLIGLGLALLAKLSQGDKGRPLPLNLAAIDFEKVTFLLIWAGLNLLLYLRWVMSVGSVSHTRLIFPAITAISLLLALGWHALLPRRWAGWFSAAISGLFLALNLYSLAGLIYPAFQPNREATAAAPIDLTYLDRLSLTGSAVYPQQPSDPAVEPGEVVLVEAHWHVIAPFDKNYSVAVTLLAPDGSVLAQRE